MITQLEQQNLGALFDTDLRASAPTPLPPQLAAKVIQHYEAGGDAGFIASLLRVELPQVLRVIDRHIESLKRTPTPPVPPSAPLAPEWVEAPPLRGRSQLALIDDAAQRTSEEMAKREASQASPTWPDHDVELNDLQRRAVKFARRKLGFSIETIARASRVRPAQIERICGDAPLSNPETGEI
jgi:hypothetical protein